MSGCPWWCFETTYGQEFEERLRVVLCKYNSVWVSDYQFCPNSPFSSINFRTFVIETILGLFCASVMVRRMVMERWIAERMEET